MQRLIGLLADARQQPIALPLQQVGPLATQPGFRSGAAAVPTSPLSKARCCSTLLPRDNPRRRPLATMRSRWSSEQGRAMHAGLRFQHAFSDSIKSERL
jgi:hypothetical protein